MAVVVVGLNQRTVPLPVLETMTVLPADLAKALDDLDSADHLEEVAVLSTCMRTEVYAVASRFHGALADVRHFLSAWSGHPPERFSDHLYAYYDDAAVTHLFKVAAGLDSAVLGEGEVLGQVRQAWEASAREGTAGPTLQVLFRHAVEAGKRVRSETAIARGTTSLSQAAVELAAARAGGLGGRRVLVVGAGDMGEAIVRAAAPQIGGGRLMIANRTAARAARLARRYGGTTVAWPQVAEAMA
ncbi:MAG TPA: glutamyl-tRNA reductase, partial [Acidimicrobiales bacterium]|nr:glutamyl-tRNA reductase [Acidimicrobiales bacterium]